ncbi:MAG: hypothetical protein Kow00124_23680 [Anaerolineae bacterium]
MAAGICLFALALLAGCAKATEIPYVPEGNAERLAALEGGRLAIVQFGCEDQRMAAEALPPEIAAGIADEQKAGLIEALSPTFEVLDLTTEEDLPDPDDRAALSAYLEEVGVDGAIRVTNAYGYQMQQSLLEAVTGKFLEQTAGEETANFVQMFGENPAIVEAYYFASDTTIVNAEGRVTWHFFGKAVRHPRPFSGTVGEEAETFVRSVLALTPTEQELVREFRPIYTQYNDYLSWMIETDLAGTGNLSYYVGYPEERADRKNIAIFPASDSSHVPTILTEEQIAAQAEVSRTGVLGWFNKQWNTARAGRWNTFWQWPEAGAALLLAVLCFVVGGIFASLYQAGGEDKSLLGQAAGMVAFVVYLAMFAALYHLLKAIF